jgi:1-deoxy-D-xylulose-5-phosphate reductoisomerase
VTAIVVLGSTGSIGTQTLDLVASAPERYRVIALAAGRNVDRLERQVRRFTPRRVAVHDADAARTLRERLSDLAEPPEVLAGDAGLEAVAADPEADRVVHGIVGAAGLRATLAAVDAGRTVALANKESMVAAGALVLERARRGGATIVPVDSEHNAIHQCLRGERPGHVRRLWLTASGGPFRSMPATDLDAVTPEDALRHPTWSMGPRITVDSATLMNKGLEVVEARFLFDLPADRIEVVIHPQSVVHSMVEFVDGSFKAQLGAADMRHPIAYALEWPDRTDAGLAPFRPWDSGPWTFEAPDRERFPCLDLAYRALAEGGSAPAALNAADEVAVEAFLERRIGFGRIPEVLRAVLDEIGGRRANCIDDILEADRAARRIAQRRIESGAPS